MRFNQRTEHALHAQLLSQQRRARTAVTALGVVAAATLTAVTVIGHALGSAALPMLTALDRQSIAAEGAPHRDARAAQPAAVAVGETTKIPSATAATSTRAETVVAGREDVQHIELGDTAPEDIRWYDGRPIRPAGTMRMLVTAYSPDEQSCGNWADGYTASGYSVWTNGMKLVAADTSLLPFGSLVSVPGYDADNVVPVLDRGGKIKGHRLDVLYPTHEQALQWGAQWLDVTVWKYADGEPAGFRTQHQNHPHYRAR